MPLECRFQKSPQKLPKFEFGIEKMSNCGRIYIAKYFRAGFCAVFGENYERIESQIKDDHRHLPVRRSFCCADARGIFLRF